MKFTNYKQFLYVLNGLIQEGWFIENKIEIITNSATIITLALPKLRAVYILAHYNDPILYDESLLIAYRPPRGVDITLNPSTKV